jgi:hypothetical protein
MNSPLLVSLAVTLTTTLAATLWAALVATGMSPAPDGDATGRRLPRFAADGAQECGSVSAR